MTNFATFIATANGKAPVAQRGKAKQKRADLRLVGLGLVVTRDGGIPLTWHAYPGSKPDVTQFPDMITQLKTRYEQVCAAAGTSAQGADLTVVFDAGQNSDANFAHLAQAGLSYVGSVPASDCPDLLALPASDRTLVGKDRFGGLTQISTPAVTSTVWGAAPSSPTPRNCTTARPWASTAPPWPRPARSWMGATLAAADPRRKEKVAAEIEQVTAKPGPAASSPGN